MILALLLAAAPTLDTLIDGPPAEWLAPRTPFGFDVTSDGKVWINTNPIGEDIDYSILANDIHKAAGQRHRRVWLRSVYKPKAGRKVREQKTLYSFDCEHDTYTQTATYGYSADGGILFQYGMGPMEFVVPGTHGENWRNAACMK